MQFKVDTEVLIGLDAEHAKNVEGPSVPYKSQGCS